VSAASEPETSNRKVSQENHQEMWYPNMAFLRRHRTHALEMWGGDTAPPTSHVTHVHIFIGYLPRYGPRSLPASAAILDLLFSHFGPPTMSQLAGFMFPANGVMISLHFTKILWFHHFAISVEKCLFPPILHILLLKSHIKRAWIKT